MVTSTAGTLTRVTSAATALLAEIGYRPPTSAAALILDAARETALLNGSPAGHEGCRHLVCGPAGYPAIGAAFHRQLASPTDPIPSQQPPQHPMQWHWRIALPPSLLIHQRHPPRPFFFFCSRPHRGCQPCSAGSQRLPTDRGRPVGHQVAPCLRLMRARNPGAPHGTHCVNPGAPHGTHCVNPVPLTAPSVNLPASPSTSPPTSPRPLTGHLCRCYVVFAPPRRNLARLPALILISLHNIQSRPSMV